MTDETPREFTPIVAPVVEAPAGNDLGSHAMAIAPASAEQQEASSREKASRDSGHSSYTENDRNRAVARAHDAVAAAMANPNATDDSIIAAARAAGGTEFAEIAEKVGSDTVAARKFNILGGSSGKSTDEHKGPNLMEMIVGGAAAVAAPKYVLNDAEREGQMVPTTEAIAALEQFRPQAGLPVAQRAQGQSRGMG